MATEGQNYDNDATMENPLRNFNDVTLAKDVVEFAREHGFEEEEMKDLKRGAFAAKYKRHVERVAEDDIVDDDLPIRPPLRRSERLAIRNESQRLLKQSRDMYITVIACAAAAVIQGWDQTGTNGANLTWPKAFDLVTKDPDHRDDDDKWNKWIIGFVNAAPYISASLVGCALTDPINRFFGRRGTIFFAALWCFASVIGSAFTKSWEQLLVARLCLGIGMGAKASTVPVFAAESAPAYFRGSIVMSWQLWVAFGIFLGFSANLAVYQIHHIAWRMQLGSAFIPTIPLLILIYIAPESPRWYMRNGKYQEAFQALKRLRVTELQAYRDLYLMHKQLQIENREYIRSKSDKSYARRFVQLFTIPRIRRATLASSIVMLAQQLCGINVLAFYSSTLFRNVHSESDPEIIRQAFLLSWGFGLINTVFALPAFKTIDKFGRRPLLLFSIANMAWTMLAAGLCFKIPLGNTRTGLVTFFLFIFAAFYSPGQGPVPFTYSAEAYPLSHREVGMGLSVAVNLFFAAVLTVTFPTIDETLHHTGALCLFAGLNVVAFVLVFLWVPETAQKTLEELSRVFGKQTWDHVKYQTCEALPHHFHRYVLRNDKVSLHDFYETRSRSSIELPDLDGAP